MGASVIERFPRLTVRPLLARGAEELKMLMKTSQKHSELVEVLNVLRGQNIDFQGPFRTGRGGLVFRMEDQIVLESELVELHQSGKLSRAGIAVLLRKLRAR